MAPRTSARYWNGALPEAVDSNDKLCQSGTDYNAAVEGTTLIVQLLRTIEPKDQATVRLVKKK